MTTETTPTTSPKTTPTTSPKTTPTTSPNLDLLRRTLEAIKENPEHWDQSTWRCSTGMCFAGWAAELAGGRYLVPMHLADSEEEIEIDGQRVTASNAANLVTHPSIETAAFVFGDINVISIPNTTEIQYFAERALGLTEDQADGIFSGGNTVKELEHMIRRLETDPHASLYGLEDD